MKGKKGKIIIAQKPKRGSSIKYPTIEGYKRIDCTSGSNNKINGEKAIWFSPLYLGPVEDKEGHTSLRFENYWQYTKVYPQLGHIDEYNKPTSKWTKWRDDGFKKVKINNKKPQLPGKGIRTPPAVSSLKQKVRKGEIKSWAPSFAIHNNTSFKYIEARKSIYIPIYIELVKKQKVFQELYKKIQNGENVILIDIDGPPLNLYPNGIDVENIKEIKSLLNNGKYPFGHGYCLALALSDIDLELILS